MPAPEPCIVDVPDAVLDDLQRRPAATCLPDDFADADELVDTVMLYWVTDSYHSSARFYCKASHDPWTPSHDRRPVVEAPVAVPVVPHEPTAATRHRGERYRNLQRWTEMPASGHFASMEEPDLLVADIRDFFRDRT